MSSPVERNATVAVRREEEHLVLESIRCQWPAMTEDDRLSLAPVLVVNLRAIFCCNETHCLSLLLVKSDSWTAITTAHFEADATAVDCGLGGI